MSSREIEVKKSFTCSSVSLVPMKEGVLLCLRDQVLELWNFDLTECIRPIPRLVSTQMLISLSDELITWEWHWRTVKQAHRSNFGSLPEANNSMELHEDDSVNRMSV